MLEPMSQGTFSHNIGSANRTFRSVSGRWYEEKNGDIRFSRLVFAWKWTDIRVLISRKAKFGVNVVVAANGKDVRFKKGYVYLRTELQPLTEEHLDLLEKIFPDIAKSARI